jgi:hypothetical protein
MNYRPGFKIKPDTIEQNGQVSFTDGTTTGIIPSQAACEAYGYQYNPRTGVCTAFPQQLTLNTNVNNDRNLINGGKNQTNVGTRNTFIMGQSNTITGSSRNNLIIGNRNEVSFETNNTTVLGSFGYAQRDGEIVMGGGAFNGAGAGYGQSSTIHLSVTTTDGSGTAMFVNNSTTQTVIKRVDSTGESDLTNLVTGYDLRLIGIRTGGSSGSGAVNDRVFLTYKGILKGRLNDSADGVETLGSRGTVTGWTVAFSIAAVQEWSIVVTGAADMNISWFGTLNLTEMRV